MADQLFDGRRFRLLTIVDDFLAVLGIVIGVSAVITMVTLGSGATSQVTNDIASLGSRVLIVNPGQGMGPGSRAAAPFDLADARAIEQEISGLKAVAPIVLGGRWLCTETRTGSPGQLV